MLETSLFNIEPIPTKFGMTVINEVEYELVVLCVVLQRFKTLLIIELSKVFPNEMAKYRQLRGDDRPPLERI